MNTREVDWLIDLGGQERERVPPEGMTPAGTRPNRPPNTHTATLFPSTPFSPSSPPFLVSPPMPTCRRKRVLLIEPPLSLLQALKSDPNKHVYYLAKTGEIFDTYEQAFISSLFYL